MKDISVGSTSKHKLEAVRLACANLDLSYYVFGLDTKSGQNEQPIGFEETFSGALTRAKYMQSIFPEDIAIGIESGIIAIDKPLPISLDFAVVVALFEEQMVVTTSNGMVFPQKYYKAAKRKGFEKATVGSVIASKLGGDGTDPHSILSDGVLSRQETLVKAIEVALRLLQKSK